MNQQEVYMSYATRQFPCPHNVPYVEKVCACGQRFAVCPECDGDKDHCVNCEPRYVNVYEASVIISDRLFARGLQGKVTVVLPKKNGDYFHDRLIDWIRGHAADVQVEIEEET